MGEDTVSEAYVHGYQAREKERLQDQAGTLVDLLHADTSYPPRSKILEAGCGVGAQTVTLAQRSHRAVSLANCPRQKLAHGQRICKVWLVGHRN